MSIRTDHFDGNDTETVLGLVEANGSFGRSLYVNIPTLGRSRRTDGGAEDPSTVSVDFEGGIDSYERGDYVNLTFEPSDYNDCHMLHTVEKATLAAPTKIEEPHFNNTNIPKICPQCGREAAAVVKTEYDTMTGGKVSQDADMCTVTPENRGSWFGLSSEFTFVHGL